MLTPPPVKRHRVRQTSGAAVYRLLLCHKFLYRCDEQITTQQITTFLRVDVSEECSFLFFSPPKNKKRVFRVNCQKCRPRISLLASPDEYQNQNQRVVHLESRWKDE